MKPDAYLPFYGADFFSAVEGYQDAVALGYLRALWHYWQHTHCEGLPDDDDYLRRVCRCDNADWLRTKGIIFGRFFTLQGNEWHQKRASEEYQAACASYKSILERSRLGVEARNKPKDPPKTPPAKQPEVVPQVKPGVKPDVNQSESESESESDPELKLVERGGEPPPVEPPKGFPISEEQAMDSASFVGTTPEFAAKLWLMAASRGWVDAKGVRIQNWRYYLRSQWVFQQESESKAKNNGNGSSASAGVSQSVQAVVADGELKRVLAQIKRIHERASQDAIGNRTYSPQDSAKLKTLFARRGELKQLLGVTE